MPLKPATDRLGMPIFVGDTVIYGHALGRCAGLQFGKVLKIVTDYHEAYTYKAKRWAGSVSGSVLEEYDREVKEVTNYKITVWGVDEDWNYDGRGPKLRMSKGVLQFPDRIVVIMPHMVPKDVAELLKSVTVESTVYTLGLKDKEQEMAKRKEVRQIYADWRKDNDRSR